MAKSTRAGAIPAWFLPSLLAVLGGTASCDYWRAKCGQVDVEEGERLLITIKGPGSLGADCSLLPLKPGDSFVITAGKLGEDADGCPYRMAQPMRPAPLDERLNSCTARGVNLGQFCRGELAPGCAATAALLAGPLNGDAFSSSGVAEDGGMLIDWVGGSCAPAECHGEEDYLIRIERLRFSDGGAGID